MPGPLFSVVTVTRDNLEGLRRTAESIARQRCRDFEWIVIDGASQDGTAAFLEKSDLCGDARSRLSFLSEPDSGIYDAMNKGIACARGFYTVFLNAGDCFAAPDVLERMAASIAARLPDFLYGDALEIHRERTVCKGARPHATRARGMFTHHQAMLYRSEILRTMRYDLRYDIAADYDLTCRFLRAAGFVLYLPYPLCLFEAGGLSQQKTARARRQQYAIRRALGLCSAAENAWIYLMQSAALFLRRTAPGLYWRLRQRRDASGFPVAEVESVGR